jgi:opacity protein-like surface antigen
MKKILIASLLTMAVTSVAALELGVSAGRDFSETNRNYAGVSLRNSYGPVSAELGYQRTSVTDNNQDRWSLVGGYDLVKVGPVQLTPTVGGVYLNNRTTSDGYAMTAGLEASMPIPAVKNLTGVIDYSYQMGQERVNQFNGSRVSVGLRYKF